MCKTLNDLLNTRLSWLKDLSNEDVIIHSDIDGLLSMGFLQHYANMKQIVGLYDLETFYMKNEHYYKPEVFKNICAIDLDVSYCGIRNVGHHVTCVKSSPNSLNINEFINVSSTTDKCVDNYYKKFPLNTVILLYSIFNVQPKSDEEIALLIYADSVFENYTLYKENVTNWLKYFKQDIILDALENRYEKLLNIIDNKIAPITNTIKSRKQYSQCLLTSTEEMYGTIVYKYNGNPKNIINLIKEITNWNILDLPNELYEIKIFNNTKVVLSKEPKDSKTIKTNLKKLNDFLIKNEKYIVSSSMTYKNEYKITINLRNTLIRLINDEYKFVRDNSF